MTTANCCGMTEIVTEDCCGKIEVVTTDTECWWAWKDRRLHMIVVKRLRSSQWIVGGKTEMITVDYL